MPGPKRPPAAALFASRALLLAVGLLLALWPETRARAGGSPACRPQRPQDFLVRKNYLRAGALEAGAHARSLRYRVERNGSVAAPGVPSLGRPPASSFAQSTTLMGKPVSLHRAVVPALACVERRIKQACRATPYEPSALGGYRERNTFHTGEVTNHLFGIALDIDPHRNPCCHCVEPWSSDPKCARKASTPFERAALPKCWVEAFERYGFYWLGHDVLEDTMHFEFLGDPARVGR
jgi:hypothetical protein